MTIYIPTLHAPLIEPKPVELPHASDMPRAESAPKVAKGLSRVRPVTWNFQVVSASKQGALLKMIDKKEKLANYPPHDQGVCLEESKALTNPMITSVIYKLGSGSGYKTFELANQMLGETHAPHKSHKLITPN